MSTLILSLGVFVVAMFFLSLGVVLTGRHRLKGACHGGGGPVPRAADGTPLICDRCLSEATGPGKNTPGKITRIEPAPHPLTPRRPPSI